MSLRKEFSKSVGKREVRRDAVLVSCAFTAGFIVAHVLGQYLRSKQTPNEGEQSLSLARNGEDFTIASHRTVAPSIPRPIVSGDSTRIGSMYRVSVMTFNVWRPLPLDLWLEENQKFGRVEYDRRRALAAFFEHYRDCTELFALQECTRAVLDVLSENKSLCADFAVVCALTMSSEITSPTVCEQIAASDTLLKDSRQLVQHCVQRNAGRLSEGYERATMQVPMEKLATFGIDLEKKKPDSKAIAEVKTDDTSFGNHGEDGDLHSLASVESMHSTEPLPLAETHFGACIVFNKHMFQLMDCDCGLLGGANWTYALLKSRFETELPPLVVFSVHLSFPGMAAEMETGKSPRVEQLKAVFTLIRRVVGSVAADDCSEKKPLVILGGDMNDHFHCANVAMQNGMRHCFRDSNRVMAATFPTPASYVIDSGPDPQSAVTYDWLFHSTAAMHGTHAKATKAISAQLLEFTLKGIYPSDHYPVHAVYQISC